MKLDAATGIETRHRRPEVQPDVGQRHRRRVRDARRAVPQHRVGQGRHLLRRLPQLRDHARHAVSQLPEGAGLVRARRRASGRATRSCSRSAVDVLAVADPAQRNLGYAIGAGAYRLSPHALAFPERIGPLLAGEPAAAATTPTPAACSATPSPYQQLDASKHDGMHSALYVAGRDVRRLPRRDQRAADQEPARPLGGRLSDRAHVHGVAGQPLRGSPRQRQLRSRSSSATASRATCSRTTASPGRRRRSTRTASRCRSRASRRHRRQAAPVVHPPLRRRQRATCRSLIGEDVDAAGAVAPYPELSTFSFSSADHKSPYSRGFWTNVDRKGGYAQQQRLAWDRLRNVLDSMTVPARATAAAGSRAPLAITVANTGSGHNFPTGFPEGRIAWVAVHAFDLATGSELHDPRLVLEAQSLGVGNLTTKRDDRSGLPAAATGSCRPVRPIRSRSSSRRWRRWATAARRWTCPTRRRSTW